MSSESPTVSIVMPVFNAGAYLSEAIESVLRQTYEKFELIIINDGSTDNSADILNFYQNKDRRLIVHHQKNQGPSVARNLGCFSAQGEYIAFCDADDILRKNRLATQVAFLNAHSQIGICGSAFKIFDNSGSPIHKHPLQDESIRSQLFFDSAFATSTVILRRSLITDIGLKFNPVYRYAEDYRFWVEASYHCKLANLPEVLILYRRHKSQMTHKGMDQIIHNAGMVRRDQLKKLDLLPDKDIFSLHQSICTGRFERTRSYLEKANGWLLTIKEANQKYQFFPEPYFTNLLGTRWYYACRSAANLGWFTWKTFWASPLSRAASLASHRKTFFALRCALARS